MEFGDTSRIRQTAPGGNGAEGPSDMDEARSKQCAAAVWRADILALAERILLDACDYIAIQRLILRHDAIC
jgi:hypothetical protein